MKWRPKSQHLRIGLTAFFVIAASMILYLFLFRTSYISGGIKKLVGILNPIIYGFMIAYLLNPVMQMIENVILKIVAKTSWRPGRRSRLAIRIVSVLMAAAFMILIIYALISRIIPELIESIKSIIVSFPLYVDTVNGWINRLFTDESMDIKTTELITEYAGRFEDWVNSSIMPKLDDIMASVTNSLVNVLIFFKNFFLGFIISLYILSNKDSIKARGKRFVYSVFSITVANQVIRNLRFIDKKFGGFLIGKIIDSFIIGVITYICLGLLRMPYQMLIAIVIGVTNIIPFFGPFIGAIPAVVLIFVLNPLQALYFIIFIIVLQQFDGNFLGPKILGNSVGTSSFMVLVSIIVCAGLFGPIGMVIGVPLFAIISAFVQTRVLRRTIQKDLPGDLNDYLNMKYIDPETHQPVPKGTPDGKLSLYEFIKFRDETVRSLDHPLKYKSWDKTEEEVRREIDIIEHSKECERAEHEMAQKHETAQKHEEPKSGAL